ncbi:methyltransferase domain-containing protein [Nocardioides sp. NPDC051685]|uniref:methyltransferase domain-containing protein n=1 Tax=Nocardioides sp. NPDC051685 TaxID=3364334 RepID=UPI00379DC826
MTVDTHELETKVQQMYREVALHPDAGFHFELGRALAESVGYDPARLDLVPAEAVESFAGVGHFFDLAAPQPGETLLDLGSGSGMDVFYAATLVGATGHVIGVDFTPEQLAKARRLGGPAGATVEFREGRLDRLPVEDATADCVISNGVINLCPDKAVVFAEAARVLRPGGRLALADIVTDVPLAEGIVCNADLWAACIGGAAQVDDYVAAIEKAGLVVELMRRNRYAFLSAGAQGAATTYGVKSVSLLARKPAWS